MVASGLPGDRDDIHLARVRGAVEAIVEPTTAGREAWVVDGLTASLLAQRLYVAAIHKYRATTGVGA